MTQTTTQRDKVKKIVPFVCVHTVFTEMHADDALSIALPNVNKRQMKNKETKTNSYGYEFLIRSYDAPHTNNNIIAP